MYHKHLVVGSPSLLLAKEMVIASSRCSGGYRGLRAKFKAAINRMVTEINGIPEASAMDVVGDDMH